MEKMQLQQRSRRALLALCLMTLGPVATASLGVREAAVSLERQLTLQADAKPAELAFKLPLTGSSVVLQGHAKLEALDAQRCRRTLELVHDQPFERRGLRITSLSRRSVQEGSCQNFANAMVAQADATAKNIAEQIGLATTQPDTTPGERVLVSQAGKPAVQPGAAVQLTVLEKALIRDAPNREGEKLSRADKGMRLNAQRIVGNPDWFVLDGGLRFISAQVVDVSDAATATAPARGDLSRVRVKVMERAVLRNAPSFKGQKVASINAGVERLARKVPGAAEWFEVTDGNSSAPMYIHESVVVEKPGALRLDKSADGRNKKRL